MTGRAVDLAGARIPLSWVGALTLAAVTAAASGLAAYDRFAKVESGLSELRGEVAGLRTDLAALRGELGARPLGSPGQRLAKAP